MAESGINTENPVEDDEQQWWSSWLQTAFEFMKKDLGEFGQTVHDDAITAITATSSVVKQTLRLDDRDSVASQTKEGLQNLLGKISDAFYPSFEKDEDEILVIRDSQPVVVEKWHAHLHYIQTHPSNYSHKPEGSVEQYQKWLEDFALENHQKDISDVLTSSPDVRTLYTGLVPAVLSNLEFWQRFFYRGFQADEIQAKRAELVRRAEGGEPLDEYVWDVDEQKVPKNNDTLKQPKEHQTEPEERANDGDSKSNASLFEDIDRAVVINASPSSSDTDASKKTNTEDEWEKDFDLEEANVDTKIAEAATGTEEDWENWE